jgi:hypothetical protein
MRIAASLVLILLSAGAAAAQPPRPKACRYLVDVKDARVAATTQPDVNCEYGGKILMSVNNLDDRKYRLEIGRFKINPAAPDKCASPTTPASSPILGTDSGGVFRFNLNSESTHTRKKSLKALGARSTECFKFDIVLMPDGGGTPIHTLDPDLQITEPQPPPPPKPKPGPGR